jgi:hypothetical protein
MEKELQHMVVRVYYMDWRPARSWLAMAGGLVGAYGAGRLICLKTEICGGLSLFWLNLGKPVRVNSILKCWKFSKLYQECLKAHLNRNQGVFKSNRFVTTNQ